MKRSFPPPAREALFGIVALTALLGLGTACEPDNNVQPGAPVLTAMALVGQAAPIVVTKDTVDCPAAIVGGEACDPSADTLCRHPAPGWCTCAADMMDMTMGKWDCSDVPVLGVIWVFDRLLDTAPYDATYPAQPTNVITGSAPATAPQFMVAADYGSTGTPMGLNPLLATFVFGNPRNNGPSLFGTPDPCFPSATASTVQLDPGQVRAKDGKTAFTSEGTIAGGMISFTMPAFTASIAPPDAMAMTPATITGNNYLGQDNLPAHVKVTANGVDVSTQVDVTVSGATATVTPMKDFPWAAGATIVITLDATTPNACGQPIDAAQTATFTAP